MSTPAAPATEARYLRLDDVTELLYGDEFERWEVSAAGKGSGVTLNDRTGISIFRGWMRQRVAALDWLLPEREAAQQAAGLTAAVELADHQVTEPHVEGCDICMTFIRQHARRPIAAARPEIDVERLAQAFAMVTGEVNDRTLLERVAANYSRLSSLNEDSP